MPTLNRKFNDFRDFAFASITEIIEPEYMDTCYKRSAIMMESVVLINNGGSFAVKPLPEIAQISPIMGIEALDLNEDQFLDVVICGNMYGAEDDVVRYDAGKGLVMLGKGDGTFTPLLLPQSGYVTQHDARGLVSIKNPGNTTTPYALVTAINQSLAMTYVPNQHTAELVKTVAVDPSKTRYTYVEMRNARRKVEVYCGSSYRSQTSCNIVVPKSASVKTANAPSARSKARSKR
jgi:hypothetical protein